MITDNRGLPMKRVRFETVPIGGKCQTEYKENIIKTEKVRIYTMVSITEML